MDESSLPPLPEGATLSTDSLPKLPEGATLNKDVAPASSGGIGDFTRGAISAAKRVGIDTAANIARLGGGLLGAAGASPEFLDPRFKNIEALSDQGKAIAAPDSTAGKVGEFAGSLAGANPLSIVGGIAGAGQEAVRSGAPLGEAAGETAKEAAKTVPAILLGGELPSALSHAGYEGAAQALGGTLTRRALTAGIGSLGLSEAERAAHNATSPEDQQQPFNPSEAGQNLASGLLFGALRGRHETPAAPKPSLDEQAGNLQRGVDQRLATPALAPPAENPDFVVNSRGQAVPPDQAAAAAQGGPGFEQQTQPPPVAPNPPAPAPLALEHQPDVVVDAQGRAVVNKGDRTGGQPFGGPGLDEQAPQSPRDAAIAAQRAAPSGPIGEAVAALPTTHEIPQPAEAANERELLANAGVEPGRATGGVAPESDNGAGPSGNANLRQQYADRQSRIDALNAKRKTEGLSEQENSALHDLNEQQQNTNPVSGMPNRRALDQALASGEYSHAVAMDVDGFKSINDTLGHGVGDLVLQKLGQHLNNESNGDILFTHNSGDEYAAAAKGDPTAHLQRLQAELASKPFTVEYVDADGNKVEHTLNGLGVTFGVGKELHEADLAANASKEQRAEQGLRRRREDQRPASAEPVQTPEGSATAVGEDGGRSGVPGAERAAAGGVANADREGNRQGDTSASGRDRSPSGAETTGSDSRARQVPDGSVLDSGRGLSKEAVAEPDSVNAAEPVAAGTGAREEAAREAGSGRTGRDVHGEDATRVGGEPAHDRAALPNAPEPAAAELNPRDNPEAFGLPPKPKSPVAGKPNTYIPGPRDFNEHHHDLLDFAALHGGLDPAAWRAAGVDKAQIRPGKDSRGSMRFPRAPLWRHGGMTPDALREAMVERGFLPPDSEHGEANSEANHAIDKVLGALNQDEKHYTYGGQETQAAIRHLERLQEEQAHAAEIAKERGFESAEAMHEHDAANFMPYDGSPREDIPFSRPAQKPGMSRAALAGAIHDTIAKWQGDAPRVQVLQSHADAPPALRNARGFGGDVEGAYHNGTTYLFADAIRSPKRALQVLAHEAIGHYGMERAFAKEWPKLVKDIAALREKAPAYMRKVFAEVDRRYPGADAETNASETLAVMAEHGIHNALMDRVFATMRRFMRSLGFDLKFSDAELRQMLVAAKRRVEGERSQEVTRQAQPAFAKRDTVSGDMFGGGESKPTEKSVSDKRAAYDAASERAREATNKFNEVRQQYRDKKIGDAEFLKAKAEHDTAQKEFDAAEHAYKAGKPVGDLFGGATSRDHVDAAVRAKEDALSGKGAAPTMRQGAGELFAGGRPEQARIEGESKALKPARGPLSVRMGDKEFPVDSFEDASRKFLELKDRADIGGQSAVRLVDHNGDVVAHIGHRGEIYKGDAGKTIIGEPEPEVLYTPPSVSNKKEAIVSDQPAKAEPVNSLDTWKTAIRRVADGNAKADDVRAMFREVEANRQQIVDELNEMKKDELVSRFGVMRSGMSKSEIVNRVYDDMLGRFTLGKSVSWMMGRETHEEALRKVINGLTDKDVAEYADQVKAARAEREKAVAGMQNPETLEDFQRAARAAGGESKLRPEQRATFDKLRADARKQEREEALKRQAVVRQVDTGDTGMSMVEAKHTQKGHDLFVVKLGDRVERDVYNQLNIAAKRLGGYYSSFRGNGAVPGFQFKSREDAQKFMAVRGGDVNAADKVQERAEAKTEQRAESLSDKAAALREKAQEVLSAERKTNTARRASMAAGVEDRARKEMAIADTMDRIAKAQTDGTAGMLAGVRHGTDVRLLDKLLGQASWEHQRAAGVNWEKAKETPITKEQISNAELPGFQLTRGDAVRVVGDLRRAGGGKMMADKLAELIDFGDEYGDAVRKDPHKFVLSRSDGKNAYFERKRDAEAALANSRNVNGAVVKIPDTGTWAVALAPEAAIERKLWTPDYDKKVNLTREAAQKMVDTLGEGDRSLPYWFRSHLEERAHLDRMGIEKNFEFREALRDYIDQRKAPAEEDRVRRMERDLVGRNVGNDFFPTPPKLVERMVEEANIGPGMRVLEPSAGKGDIADALRAAGDKVNVDTVESSSTLRDLLEAKGHDVVGHDFMDYNPEEKYDRIVMNPPFGTDNGASHVQHAYDLLKPGGRLVAIMGDGARGREQFDRWLESVGGTTEPLPEGSFKSSFRPTGVNTRLITVDKPETTRFSKADKTDTPEFKRWFGKSAVERDGKPTVVYHGTGEDFNVFERGKLGESTQHATAPLGFHFTTDRVRAEHYAENASEGRPANERVISAYLKVENPYRMKLSEAQAVETPTEAKALRAKLESAGHDGIQIPEAKTWIAFKPEQVKSVDNRGSFDASNPDIRFSRAGERDAGEAPRPSFIDRVTGAVRPSEAQRAARAVHDAAKALKETARNVARSAWAQRDRAIGTADAAIDGFRKWYDKRPADVRSDPSKNYASIIAYQQGREIADPVERHAINTVAQLLSDQAEKIRAFGDDKLNLLSQYFPQLWADPARAEKMYADMAAKRPLAGPKGFTKQRVFADYSEGIAAGMKPAFDNPMDALMARYQSGERYLQSLRIRSELERIGALQDIGKDERMPIGYARIHDNAFAGKAAPEQIARDLNNYLAPGLNQFAAWRGFRFMENLLLGARLGFSAFHAGFTSVDAAVTHLDLGMRYAFQGDLQSTARHLFLAAKAPFRAVAELAGKGEGSRLLRQFYGQEAAHDANTAAVLDALTQGGMRGKMDPTDYNREINNVFRAFRQKSLASFVGEMTPANIAKAPLRALSALTEASTWHIANRLVPAQKAMARVEMMKYELDRVAGLLGKEKGDYAGITNAMDTDALRKLAYSVNQRVDDRLGQVAYDNLFWNRTAKDIAQASIQSLGWNAGTYNVIFKGLGDIRKVFKPDILLGPLDKAGTINNVQLSRVTGRLSYLISLNVGIAALGGITQYLLTGEKPQELKDYFFPKTGNKNPDGSDARISFPSYVKDEFAFAKHPLMTAQHKLHPAFSEIAELLNNKDFYSNEIRNPDDPWVKQAEQVAEYIAKGFLPYAAQNAKQQRNAGAGPVATALPFVGVTPAPGDITHSDFQNYVQDHYYSSHPTGGKTPESAEQSQHFFDAAAAIRRGEKPDLSMLSPKEQQSLQRYVKSNPIETHFNRLSLMEKLYAWDYASPQERAKYKLRGAILKGAGRDLQRLSPEEQATAKAKLAEIRNPGP